jgi:hypothetical protein
MKYSILLIFVIFSCNWDSEKNIKYKQPKLLTKVAKYNNALIGKELNSLEKIIDNNTIYDKIALLILSSGECTSCQNKGYNILCELNNLFNGNIFIVANAFFSEKIPCEIKKLEDKKELLKNETHLIYTPSIIIVENKIIIDIFPVILNNSEGYNLDVEVEKFIMKTKNELFCQ